MDKPFSIAELVFAPYIRFADYAVRTANWMVPDRKLLDYLLIYIHEGTCNLMVDGQAYQASKGDYCLVQPNQLCSLHGITNTITPYAHFDLFYKPERELSFMTTPGQTELDDDLMALLQPVCNKDEKVNIPVTFQLNRQTLYKEQLLKLIGLWQNGDIVSRWESNQLLGDIMLAIIKEFSEWKVEEGIHSPQSLNWITSYFSYYLSEPLSLADMAKRARLSPSRFSALFKQKFGISPHRYLFDMRIQRARELMVKSAYSLEEIAVLCGFSDAAHFSKAFKGRNGLTPGEYRREFRNTANDYA
jgi:AraC-like DNA-binding protein